MGKRVANFEEKLLNFHRIYFIYIVVVTPLNVSLLLCIPYGILYCILLISAFALAMAYCTFLVFTFFYATIIW